MTKRWWYIFPWVLVALTQNLIHEGVHFAVGGLAGEAVVQFRFLTNGWGTSQVVFAAPLAERAGAHWLAIAWSPAVVTVLIGYLLYFSRNRLIVRGGTLVNITVWYAGIIFLALDPFYYAVVSLFTGGDVEAAAAVGWGPWPVRAVAAVVLAINVGLILRWIGDAKLHPERYRPAVPGGG